MASQEPRVSVPWRLPTKKLWQAAGFQRSARQLAQVESHALFLSIDFDFGVRPDHLELDPQSSEWRSFRNWIGDEWYTAGDSLMRWRKRGNILHQAGANPWEHIAWDQDLSPLDFITPIEKLLSDRVNTAYVSDSHAWGYWGLLDAYVQNGAQPVDVIHIDAHHDCGYDNGGINDTVQGVYTGIERYITCDNWLLAGFAHGLIRKLVIVYPDWRGLQEWDSTNPPMLNDEHLEKVEVITWSEWLQGSKKEYDAISALMVRSGEWTPPWGYLDNMYVSMVKRLFHGRHISLDEYPPAGLSVGPHQAMKPRPQLFS